MNRTMPSDATIVGGHARSARLLVVLVAMCGGVAAPAQPMPLESAESRIVVFEPVLPTVFFDSGSAVIPDRYHRFESAEQTRGFSDTAVLGRTALERHHWILDVIGYRMRKHPQTKVFLLGRSSNQPELGETPEVAAARTRSLAEYLTTVWGIDRERLGARSIGGLHVAHRCAKDPLGMVEERSAVITTDAWDLVRPIELRGTVSPYVTPENAALSGRSLVVVPMIQYRFDSPEPGPLNERVIAEIIRPRIGISTSIDITGHADIVGLEDRNRKLTSDRAAETGRMLQPKRRRTATRPLSTRGVGEEAPLFTNDLPEGRFFNRTVVVRLLDAEP